MTCVLLLWNVWHKFVTWHVFINSTLQRLGLINAIVALICQEVQLEFQVCLTGADQKLTLGSGELASPSHISHNTQWKVASESERRTLQSVSLPPSLSSSFLWCLLFSTTLAIVISHPEIWTIHLCSLWPTLHMLPQTTSVDYQTVLLPGFITREMPFKKKGGENPLLIVRTKK